MEQTKEYGSSKLAGMIKLKLKHVRHQCGRTYINPVTGAECHFDARPAYHTVTCHPTKKLKELVR